MSAPSCHMLIDAGYSAGLEVGLPLLTRKVVLMPDNGEFLGIIRKLSEGAASRKIRDAVPTETFLHIYACELLERMREWVTSEDRRDDDLLVFPFWPRSLISAAGIVVHAVREVEALFPKASRIYYVRRTRRVVLSEAERVLGEPCFDPLGYVEEMERVAVRNGWKVLDPM